MKLLSIHFRWQHTHQTELLSWCGRIGLHQCKLCRCELELVLIIKLVTGSLEISSCFRAITNAVPILRHKAPYQTPLMTSGGWCGRTKVLPLSCSPKRGRGEGRSATATGHLLELKHLASSKWSCMWWMSILTIRWESWNWLTLG